MALQLLNYFKKFLAIYILDYKKEEYNELLNMNGLLLTTMSFINKRLFNLKQSLIISQLLFPISY